MTDWLLIARTLQHIQLVNNHWFRLGMRQEPSGGRHDAHSRQAQLGERPSPLDKRLRCKPSEA